MNTESSCLVSISRSRLRVYSRSWASETKVSRQGPRPLRRGQRREAGKTPDAQRRDGPDAMASLNSPLLMSR